MLRLFLVFCLALCTPVLAGAQQRPAAPDPWVRSNERVTLPAAGVSFPDRAGIVALSETLEFSRQGEGLDNVLQYVSSDRQVFATVYVYLPGLAHAGLTAFMTGQVVLGQSADVRELGSRIVAAGGHDGVAIRSDYSGFRRNLASSAAFVKAGRWIVKIRVSGPDNRADEVRAALSAMLEGVRFGDEAPPRPAAILQPGECPHEGPPARQLPGNYEQLMIDGLTAVVDGASVETRDESGNRVEPTATRVGDHWCISSRARIGQNSYSILRASAPSNSPMGTAVLLVPLNDAGVTLELVEVERERQRRFMVLFHEIGRTAVLGTYDRTLTDDQVAAIVSGADREGNRVRTSVQIRSNGDTEMVVPPPPTNRPET